MTNKRKKCSKPLQTKLRFKRIQSNLSRGWKKIRTPHATSSLQNFDMTAQWTAIKKSRIPRVLPINHFRYIQSSTRPVSNVQPRSGAIFAESKKMASLIFFFVEVLELVLRDQTGFGGFFFAGRVPAYAKYLWRGLGSSAKGFFFVSWGRLGLIVARCGTSCCSSCSDLDGTLTNSASFG